MFFSKYYEPETTQFILKTKGKVFIDVGVHVGRFVTLASASFSKVYAFEPHPSNFNMLQKNLKNNNIKNAEAINAAISNKSRDVLITNLDTNTGLVLISDTGGIKVNAFSLDDWIAQNNIDILDIDFLMIDAEGHETEVLKGCTAILQKGNASVLLESFDRNEIEIYLACYGYQYKQSFDSFNHLYSK